MPKEIKHTVKFDSPDNYFKTNPIHMAIYAYGGVGKTTFAGSSGLRTVLLDCGDAGAVTLRGVDPKTLRIVKIRSILHYLDVIQDVIAEADKIDLLIPDTLTGLQAIAIREVKPKRTFDMNWKKWGSVGSRVIECLAETRNFPNDVVYLVQEKKKSTEEGNTTISPSLTPSIRGYLSSIVDWVGRIKVDGEGNRSLDFRITEDTELKDRADLFPKLIKLSKDKPNYLAIRKRIATQLGMAQKGEANGQ